MAISEVLPNGHSQPDPNVVLSNGHLRGASKWTHGHMVCFQMAISEVLPNGHSQVAYSSTPHHLRHGGGKVFRIRKGASKWPSPRCFQMDTVECLQMAASELLPNGLSLSDPIGCFQMATREVPPNGHPGLERLRPECFHLGVAACRSLGDSESGGPGSSAGQKSTLQAQGHAPTMG